jgi:N6-L-threonylcarbamoyladenine synthase
MKLLSIETSCDETSIALLEKTKPFEYKILSHITISQIAIHAPFGGVFPMLAKREHEQNLIPIFSETLKNANFLFKKEANESEKEEILKASQILEKHPELQKRFIEFFENYDLQKIKENISMIAVTNGPGLPPALWVGVNFANALSKLLQKEIMPINHMEGHIIGALANKTDDKIILTPPIYPALSLLISGGHTEFVLSQKAMDYEKIGETLDDAVGESFDKVARMLNLPYPGGPEISKLAKVGRQEKKFLEKSFPRPLLHDNTLNFSFSGLKTAVLYFIKSLPEEISQDQKVAIATEFEESVCEVLTKKLEKAIYQTNSKTIIIGGGVAANNYLRENFEKLCEKLGVKLFISSKELSTDNALMIGLCAMNFLEYESFVAKNEITIAKSDLSF